MTMTSTFRNMKKILALFSFIMATTGAFAQDELVPGKPDPKSIEKIQAARIALISEKLKLTPAQAEKFWPVYREFTEHRLELRKQLHQAERTQDPAKSQIQHEQELIKLGLQLKQQNVDLEKNYSEKLLNVISAQQLLNLPRAEDEFRRLLLQRVQEKRDIRDLHRENMRNKLEQRQREKNN